MPLRAWRPAGGAPRRARWRRRPVRRPPGPPRATPATAVGPAAARRQPPLGALALRLRRALRPLRQWRWPPTPPCEPGWPRAVGHRAPWRTADRGAAGQGPVARAAVARAAVARAAAVPATLFPAAAPAAPRAAAAPVRRPPGRA